MGQQKSSKTKKASQNWVSKVVCISICSQFVLMKHVKCRISKQREIIAETPTIATTQLKAAT